MIVIITGPLGSGKSTTLINIARKFKEAGKSVGGIISSRIMSESGERYGYELINLTDFSSEFLAANIEIPEAMDSIINENVTRFACFTFRDDAIENGNRLISEGFGSDLLIVDEVGRWEINGGGWGPSMPLVAETAENVILSVREEVVGSLEKKWGIKPDYVITAGNEAVNKILSLIL